MDDHPATRDALAQQAGSWGVRCDSSEAAGPALAMFHDAAAAGCLPDVVLIDQHLAGMDGVALARAIKRDPAIAGTRLVLLTTVGLRRETVQEARSAGFEAFLTKPVRQSALYDCLATLMGPARGVATSNGNGAKPHEPSVKPRRSLRLLLAEDNEVNQQVALGLLERLGHRIDIVSNGTEAVVAAGRDTYDLILMDCQMPEMDGYGATKEIRRRENGGRRVPIVAMTASAMKGDRERCLAAGMDDYLPSRSTGSISRRSSSAGRGVPAGGNRASPAPPRRSPHRLRDPPRSTPSDYRKFRGATRPRSGAFSGCSRRRAKRC